MFDIGFFEMLVLSIIALVVLGPERLPTAARMLGSWIGKAKRTFFDLKADIEQEVRLTELRERAKAELEKAGLHDLKDELESTLSHLHQPKNIEVPASKKAPTHPEENHSKQT